MDSNMVECHAYCTEGKLMLESLELIVSKRVYLLDCCCSQRSCKIGSSAVFMMIPEEVV